MKPPTRRRRNAAEARPDLLTLLVKGLSALPGVTAQAGPPTAGAACLGVEADGASVTLYIEPKSDRPHYAAAGRFVVYYGGSAGLSPRRQLLLDATVEILRGIEDAPGPRATLSLPAAPAGRTRAAVPAIPLSAVTRWKNPGTGRGTAEVTLRVTHRCNQRCPFCQVAGRLEPAGDRTILAAIRRGAAAGTRPRLNITGGEPSLAAKLPAYIAAALACRYERVSVQTNAVRFADASRVRAIPASPRLSFFVSFHGFDAPTYDRATGTRGQFARAVRGINNLMDAGFPVVLNVVLTGDNLRALPPMTRRIPSLFPRYRRLLTMSFSSLGGFDGIDGRADLIPRLGDVHAVTRRALGVARRMGLTVNDFGSAGFCTLPPCILSPAGRRGLSLNASIPHGDIVYLEDGRAAAGMVKAERCRDCRYDKYCPGVLGAYAHRYGLEELSPI